MSPKTNPPIRLPLLYAIDNGNNSARVISSELREMIRFVPVIAPISEKRGLNLADEKPTFSLRQNGTCLVFGIDDVFAHGKRTSIRRLNSLERYTSPDYFKLLDVLYLHAFAAHRGNTEPISPTGVISVPISQYNAKNNAIVKEIRATLQGEHTIIDYEGCELRINIEEKRLLVIPESHGAMMHYAYDPATLDKRAGSQTAGTSLVVDVGYETTDCSLFEGLKYIRERANTIPRSGMGVVSRSIRDAARETLGDVDVSRIDLGLQAIAGIAPGSNKMIEAAPGVMIDVTALYDYEVDALALRLAHEIATLYPEPLSRVLLAGGGAYHLKHYLAGYLAPLQVIVAPDPDTANVQGAFTGLNLQANRG